MQRRMKFSESVSGSPLGGTIKNCPKQEKELFRWRKVGERRGASKVKFTCIFCGCAVENAFIATAAFVRHVLPDLIF